VGRELNSNGRLLTLVVKLLELRVRIKALIVLEG
jgi:hypothetical protein